METCPYLLHALSPLHAGTGQAVDLIDLPIARMRATGLPYVPGSSIKGVLRDACRGRPEELLALFGTLRTDGSEGNLEAGALLVGDARLLLLPVRSFRGTFAYVTSPLLLMLARRDMQELNSAPKDVPVPPSGSQALVADLSKSKNVHRDMHKIYLEDLDLQTAADKNVGAWERFLAQCLLPETERELLISRLVVVDDETMTFLWETATQVDTRVRIKYETGTADDGALWTEESLPPETVLLGVLGTQRTPRSTTGATKVLWEALPKDSILQFGGKATIGRGLCRMISVQS